MMAIVDYIWNFWKNLRSDDDFFDRLSHRWTALTLLIFALVVAGEESIMKNAIICWVPGEFEDSHKNYVDNYCWIQNTYYIPFNERIPDSSLPRQHVSYYQWVPIFLLIQALLFHLPSVFWRSLAPRTGIDVHLIVTSMNGLHSVDQEERKAVTASTAEHLSRYFRINQRRLDTARNKFFAKKWCACFCDRHSNYITRVYFFIKFLYAVNAIGQFFLLNAFLGSAYHLYGFDVISDLTKNLDWTSSGRFPRVTLCDLNIRRLGGNIHRYTVQCLLPINLFNEKIYIFIWFLLVFVSAATVFGFMVWANLLFKSDRMQFVKKQLELTGTLNEGDAENLKQFIDKYLRLDGVFVLKLISRNTNSFAVTDLTKALWEKFKLEKTIKRT
ncbi:innexin unc-9 [Lingula anatina]|uniref:Innexin n=1 Tax=Lingula anatina TaxID=7574 RepID=A0A2R2MS04_LINAN|nr:innexin unc-9 [Lingula anatina]|eukprot:XP_023933039.1 innexin unc-9 [Lingula anatina]